MSPRRTQVFLTATAVTALHVVDDATTGRDAGTTLTDHLRGAGVLLALLAAAAVTLSRLRGGAQALVALLAGSLAVTLGALHAAELVSSGFETAAVTGLLALVAGIGLISLGAAQLWSTRRGGSIPRRWTPAGRRPTGGSPRRTTPTASRHAPPSTSASDA